MEQRTFTRCPHNRRHPVGTRILAGSPIQVADRELVPLVEVTAYIGRRALVGSERVRACGRGFIRLRPVGLVERQGGRERLVPTRCVTTRMLAIMTLTGILLPLAVGAISALARRSARIGSALTIDGC